MHVQISLNGKEICLSSETFSKVMEAAENNLGNMKEQDEKEVRGGLLMLSSIGLESKGIDWG